MNRKENMIYMHRIIDKRMNEETNRIEFELSPEFIAIDKGGAIYHQGFTNHYVLIGFMRILFSPESRNEILQTAHQLGDAFTLDNGKFAVIWTGTWNNLERIGLVAVTFSAQKFEMMINEIYMGLKENNGKLVDRT